MSLTKVAEKAGVSLPTVSRVLNNRKGVSDKTVQLVRRTMEEMGYVAQPRASLRRQGEKTPGLENGSIALLWTVPVVDSMGGVGAWLLDGVTRGATEHGLNLMVDFIEGARRLPPMVDSGQVDGVILQGPEPLERLSRKLSQYPAVWLLSTGSQDWGDRVGPNNDRIGELAVRQLAERGHRQLACVTYDPLCEYPGRNYWRERSEAFQFHAARAGLPVAVIGEQEPWTEIRGWEPLASRLADAFCTLSPRPTGVFIATNVLPAFYKALEARGVAPMRDVDLIATDRVQSLLAGIEREPFWIDLRVSNIGRLAVDQLLWRLAHPSADRVRVAVEPRFQESNPNQ